MLIIHNLESVEFMGVCPDCVTGFALAWLQTVAPEMLAKAPARPRGKNKTQATGTVAHDSQGGDSENAGNDTQERTAAGIGAGEADSGN